MCKLNALPLYLDVKYSLGGFFVKWGNSFADLLLQLLYFKAVLVHNSAFQFGMVHIKEPLLLIVVKYEIFNHKN